MLNFQIILVLLTTSICIIKESEKYDKIEDSTDDIQKLQGSV